jgi:phosphoglycerol transferase MdoB-like AlkP superfamily enzyme
MLKNLKPYFSYFFFWLAFFVVARLIFLAYHLTNATEIGFTESAKTILYGLRLDASMTGYLCVLPYFLLIFAAFLPKIASFLIKTIKIYTTGMLIFLSILIILDVELYKKWGYRLDDSFIKYLSSPQEMLASSGASPIFLLLILAGLIFTISYYVFRKLFLSFTMPTTSPKWVKILRGPLGIIFFVGLVLPIRGGFQLVPINQSAVYFSPHIFANHAAVNPIWNFLAVILERTKSNQNNYLFYPENEANDIVKHWLTQSDSTDFIVKKDIAKPNIILITIESFTAKATKVLGHLDGVTPQFDSLVGEGILFKNIYSSGDRTHLGLMATLGGQPAMSNENILKNQRKVLQLPILSRDFKGNGYETGFYYGGDADFANMKTYLLNGQFNHLMTKSDFQKKDLSSKWGAFDHVVFEKSAQALAQYKEPFFANILTLSSHEPFEMPNDLRVDKTINVNNENQLFMNVMRYTDESLGHFIRQCKLQKWWQNTLVIITADHGTHLLEPKNDIDRFRIPVLFLGGALAKKGLIVETVGSQTDIAATILAQLNINHKAYKWSKNLFAKQLNPFAYFSTRNAFGFATKNTTILYDTEGPLIRDFQGTLDSNNVVVGKAFLQTIFTDFLK